MKFLLRLDFEIQADCFEDAEEIVNQMVVVKPKKMAQVHRCIDMTEGAEVPYPVTGDDDAG